MFNTYTVVKKIFLVDGLSNVSAAQIYEKLLKETSADRKYEFYFVVPEEQIIRWPYKNPPPNVRGIWNHKGFIKKLYEFFKREKPSLIHIFFEIRMFGPLISAIKLPLLLLLIKTLKSKIVLTLYSPFIIKKTSEWVLLNEIPLNLPRSILKILIVLYVKIICGLSDKIIVETDIIKIGLIEFYHVKLDKIIVIKNAVLSQTVELNREKKDAIIKKFKDKKIILCFGVISPRKGQNYAIEAFNLIREKLPNHILIIAGLRVPEFTDYEKKMQGRIEELNLRERVLILGPIEDDEVNIFFEIADMALYPYLPAIYGSGAFSFALQYKTPSIVSKIDTFQEILNGKGALFCEPGNPNQLSELIIKITNEEVKKQLRAEMRFISELRSCENISNEHLRVYQEVIG